MAELQIALEKLRILRSQPAPKLPRHPQCRSCRKKLNLEPTQLREMLAQLLGISRRQLYRRYGAKGLARRIGQKFARDSGGVSKGLTRFGARRTDPSDSNSVQNQV